MHVFICVISFILIVLGIDLIAHNMCTLCMCVVGWVCIYLCLCDVKIECFCLDVLWTSDCIIKV